MLTSFFSYSVSSKRKKKSMLAIVSEGAASNLNQKHQILVAKNSCFALLFLALSSMERSPKSSCHGRMKNANIALEKNVILPFFSKCILKIN